MGWVGIVALAASAAFLLYYHPPRSWTFATPNSPAKASESDQKLIQDKQEVIQEDAKERTGLDESSKDAPSPESTPKATPVISSTQVDIPSFNLDDRSDAVDKSPGSIPSNANASQTASVPLDTQAGTLPSASTVQDPSPSGRSPPRLKPLSREQAPPRGSPGLMPPPPRPSPNASLRPPPSAASSLRVPPTKASSSSSLSPSPLKGKAQNTSKQVTLKPGHSPLDWAALTASQGGKLRGANLPPTLIRVTPSMLKAQNGRKGRDAWTSYQNKVYNITPFLPFHPGGEGELMRGAGKDSEKLFLEYHPWVNWDGMLGECLVGILVSEEDGQQDSGSSELDTMD